MSYVKTNEFVKALESIGISFPKNTTRATIKLGRNDVVRIDCEVMMEHFVDVTTMANSAVRMSPSYEKVTRRFRLVEDRDKTAPPSDVGGIVRRGI